MIEDRLSRISALRPVSSSSVRSKDVRGTAAHNTERLLALLEAECRGNRCGEHLALRRRFPEPRPLQPSPRAMRLLAPGVAERVVDPASWLFLDTETTGLSGGTGTYAFLVGIGWWEADEFVVEQFFMRNHAEEASLLAELAQRLSAERPLVTFNGKSFDWPLLETRYRMSRIGDVATPPVHIDLLHPARQLFRFRLQSVALSEVETHVLGIDRGYDIPSASIPGRYFDFLRGGPAEPVVEIFHHNQMDLRGLAALAVHVAGLLEKPESAACGSAELYGISRILQRGGEDLLAGSTYERALTGSLPAAAQRSAKRELALFARRRGHFDRALQLWHELAEESDFDPEAYENLAIHYEHRSGQITAAIDLVRRALIKLQAARGSARLSPQAFERWHARFHHRLKRLELKAPD